MTDIRKSKFSHKNLYNPYMCGKQTFNQILG